MLLDAFDNSFSRVRVKQYHQVIELPFVTKLVLSLNDYPSLWSDMRFESVLISVQL